MDALQDYTFRPRPTFQRIHEPDLRPAVCVVIICTVASARVRRKEFKDWDAAQDCADKWRRKNKTKQTFIVTVERL